MFRTVLVGSTALSLMLFACSSSGGTPDASIDAAIGTPADASVDAGNACPDEIDLTRATLPCDCYGHEANSTTIVDPNCKTQVVCCPGIGNLRCEDHEFLDPDGGWVDTIADCPADVDLDTARLPCKCYGLVVAHPEQAMPGCTGVVKCSSTDQALKCE